MPISVLYIHAIGSFGGSSRSLLEMIKAFPAGTVLPYVITPQGNVPEFFEHERITTMTTMGITQIDNTRYGFYRGYRWLILLRELFYLVPTLLALVKAKRKWKDIDIIHVNDLNAILAVFFAKLIFRRPVFVHVRSVQQIEKTYLRRFFIKGILKYCSDAIIAIDRTVERSLPSELAVQVVHNGFSVEKRLQPPRTLSPLLGELPHKSLNVALVGNLLLMKGVYEFVEAAKLCKERNLRVNFILVGGSTREPRGLRGYILKKLRFVHDVKADIQDMICRYGLENDVYFIGFVANIQEIYGHIDVLCFPSHLNAVGRPVIEAAFSKIPSIVAINDPLEDTIVDGKTGLCIAAKNAKALADAIEFFYLRPEERQRMGALAYELALQNFDIQINAKKILEMYQKVGNPT